MGGGAAGWRSQVRPGRAGEPTSAHGWSHGASAVGNVGYDRPMRSDPIPKRRHSALGWFLRNPQTGEVVVAQFPNVPLWTFLAATAVRLVLSPDGLFGSAVTAVGTASLAVWAVMELGRGDSPFRRALGGVVLLRTLIGVIGG